MAEFQNQCLSHCWKHVEIYWAYFVNAEIGHKSQGSRLERGLELASSGRAREVDDRQVQV